MPTVIIETNPRGNETPEVTFRERILAANLESSYYAAQLIERLSWATADAETIESAEAPGASNRDAPARAAVERPRVHRTARRAPLVVSALVVFLATALTLTSVALADVHQRGRRSNGRIADQTTTGTALQWYRITNQTIAAAAYPEPITQSHAWSVSWLAAARAIGRHGDARYAVAAFAQALHDTLAAQVPGQQAQLDADLAQTLAATPDGTAKSAGITVDLVTEAADSIVHQRG